MQDYFPHYYPIHFDIRYYIWQCGDNKRLAEFGLKVQEIKDRQPYNHEIEQLHHQFFRELCKMNEKPRVPTGYREESQEEKSEKLRLDAVRAMNNLRRFVRNNA